jgi:probable F420-dependent oxidoreductase
VKLGVVYPQTELQGDPEAVGRFARAAEDLGFDHLLAYDHVLGAVHAGREPPLTGPYTEHDPFHEPLVMFSYIAGITRRIELVTGVLVLPQRQTALVAKQCADLDLLSGERLRVAVGSGWNYVEYDSLGQRFEDRGARLDEQVPLLRRLWAEPVVSFQGRFDRIDRAAIKPRPRRVIPIWFGGHSEVAYRRAARLGDGFLFVSSNDKGVAALGRVRHHLQEAQRDSGAFGVDVMLTGRASAAGLGAQVQAVVDGARRWQELGATHASVVSMGRGLSSLDAHLEFLHAVAAKRPAI